MSGATILIADDHPLFRDALRLAVGRAAPHASVIEAGGLAEAMAAMRAETPPDLVLLDLKMDDCEGFSGLALLHAERPGARVLVVSGADPSKGASGAQELGAIGFVSKSAGLSEIADAIGMALEGRSCWPHEPASDPAVSDAARKIASLTPAQVKVLLGILKGRLNKQIAFDMNISEATVKAHVTAIMRKLDVHSRTQAALAARALALESDAAL